VLLEIFAHTLRKPDPLTPFQLASICSSWLTIAFNTCELWSRVDLTLGITNYVARIELLSQWIARAGVTPIYIKLRGDNSFGWYDIGCTETIRQLFDLIALRQGQIRSLKVWLPTCWINILDEKDLSWPNLSKLHISTSKDAQPIVLNKVPARLFARSPALKRLSIHNLFPSSFLLPWSNLLHLKLSSISPVEMCQALHWCKSLQTCRSTSSSR